jgi:ATP-dependent Clp protease ATP-binding subunit ClpA
MQENVGIERVNILAAASHSSELEECLKSVLKDSQSSNDGVILFFGDRKS